MAHRVHADDSLTAREQEVLALLGSGRTTVEIAELLGMRPSAVNGHVRSLCRKTGAQNGEHAARLYRDDRIRSDGASHP